MILAPLVRGRKGRTQGSLRGDAQGRVSCGPGSMARWSTSNDPPELVRQKSHHIEAVIDRVVDSRGRPQPPGRIDQAGRAARRRPGAGQPRGKIAPPASRVARPALQHALCLPELQDQLRGTGAADVQLQQPLRRLPGCEGLGARVAFDPELVVPDTELSLADGAIVPWKDAAPAALRKHKAALARLSWPRPASAGTRRWRSSKPQVFQQLLHGDGKDFPGLLAMLEKEYATTTSEPSSSGWRRFAAKWSARRATAPGCGPRPARSASPAGRSTKSRP